VFCAQPEETNKHTVRLVMGKLAKRIFHDPKIFFDYDAYDRARPLIEKKLVLLDLYQSLDWVTLRSDIHAAVREGCRAIFIDPVTNLTNLVDSSEANTILQEFAQELAFIAKDLDIMVFIFCHLKAPLQGRPHERGGSVQSSQFAGSRAMMRSCHLMLGLEGDKDPDKDEAGRNMRRLVILEDRAYGSTGAIALHYDTKTGLYHEMKEVGI
jgi:twinkle protein